MTDGDEVGPQPAGGPFEEIRGQGGGQDTADIGRVEEEGLGDDLPVEDGLEAAGMLPREGDLRQRDLGRGEAVIRIISKERRNEI